MTFTTLTTQTKPDEPIRRLRDFRDAWLESEHSQTVQRGRIRWHVQIAGAGEPVLLVHGTGASSHSFAAVMRELALTNTVIAPDLPGHALSHLDGRVELTLPAMAAALRDLLDALEVSPVMAVGHSAGAAILVQMALEDMLPGARLVGLAAAIAPFRGIPRALFPVAARLLAASSIVPAMVSLSAHRDEALVRRTVARTGSTLPDRGLAHYAALAKRPSHVAAVLSMMASWDLDALYDALPSLEHELVLLAGENDRAVSIFDQRVVAERAPRGVLHVLSDAGHLLHEERPQEVAWRLARMMAPP